MKRRIPIPVTEAARLAALDSYQILDSAPETNFDHLVSLAALICETPIAAISLVDAERQWFKAKVGLEIKETTRDLAFCAYTICGDKPLVVENAATDAAFFDHPLVVSENGIRFYAGVPLINSDGYQLGSLCAVDTSPRKLSPEKLEALSHLAQQAVALMELRRSMLRYKEQEAHLASSSRLAALGEMAGGVAHEINTPLNAILMGAEEIRSLASEPQVDAEEVFEMGTLIAETAQRISKIVKGLKAFARDGSTEEPELTTAQEVLNQVMNLSRERVLQSSITFKLNIPEKPIELKCRPIQIGQVLLNLLNNSFDAVHGKAGAWINVEIAEAGDRVFLQVTDSGNGLTPEVQKKLFQPFFTTKDPQKGTGIGLSISKGIIESHNGKIYLDTKCSNTKFVIELPRGLAQENYPDKEEMKSAA